MSRSRFLFLVVSLSLALAVALGALLWLLWGPTGARTSDATDTSGVADIGGPFELVDQTGKTVTDADFRGRLMLVYFGYTFCPDFCPTDLQAMAQTLDMLGADADQVQPIFITIDPDRDTVATLANYVPLFHPRLLGLTGDAAQTAQALAAYRVYAKKVEPTNGGTDYLMDHSVFIYLMDRDGHFRAIFPNGTSAADLAAGIRQELTR